MDLKTRINEDMKAALKAKESARLGALRLLLAAIKQKEIDERISLDDGQVIGIIEKLIKQRKEAIAQYEAAGRPERAAAEKFEAEVLAAYLPQALDAAAIQAVIEQAVAASDARTAADMGKVMALVKPQLAGRADMAEVARLVKAKLAGA